MDLAAAQTDVRDAFRDGAPGEIVAGVLWLASAAVATWVGRESGVWLLVLGGALIYPLTSLALRATGSRGALAPDNPLRALAIQVAFTVPLAIPLILAAALARPRWFYAGFLIVVGAHYLPFVFLYGMKRYAVLGLLMVAAGWILGMLGAGLPFALGGWIGGALLLACGVWTWLVPRSSRR